MLEYSFFFKMYATIFASHWFRLSVDKANIWPLQYLSETVFSYSLIVLKGLNHWLFTECCFIFLDLFLRGGSLPKNFDTIVYFFLNGTL